MLKIPQSLRTIVALLALTLLYFCPRLSRFEIVFSDLRPTFLEADCYTRLERVREIERNHFLPIRYHHFENAPFGVVSHVTCPLDYAILLLSLPFRCILSADAARELAGVWISPLLGLVGLLVMWLMLKAVRGCWWVLCAYSTFPAIAWAQNIGRPDHQSLLVVLLSWVLVAEWLILNEKKNNRLLFFNGAAWGLALWVSFWEPLVFCFLIFFLQLFFRQGTWLKRDHHFFFPLGTCLILRFVLDPLPRLPDSADVVYLQNWARIVGELRGSSLLETIYWTGLWIPLVVVSSFTLFPKVSSRKAVIFVLVLLCITTILNFWQVRWSPYTALTVATLGILFYFLNGIDIKKIFWAIVASVWIPVYYAQSVWEWRQPFEGVSELHKISKIISSEPGTILAPWWISPPLGYLAEARYVASSSHQSISGIVDASEFFITPHWSRARKILIDREVNWIVTAEPEKMYTTSLAVVRGLYLPAEESVLNNDLSYRVAMGTRLARGIVPDGNELSLRAVLGPYRVYRFLPRTEGGVP